MCVEVYVGRTLGDMCLLHVPQERQFSERQVASYERELNDILERHKDGHEVPGAVLHDSQTGPGEK